MVESVKHNPRPYAKPSRKKLGVGIYADVTENREPTGP